MCTTYKLTRGTHEFSREFYKVPDKSEMIIDTMKKGVAVVSIIEITEDEYNKVEMYVNKISAESDGENK